MVQLLKIRMKARKQKVARRKETRKRQPLPQPRPLLKLVRKYFHLHNPITSLTYISQEVQRAKLLHKF